MDWLGWVHVGAKFLQDNDLMLKTISRKKK